MATLFGSQWRTLIVFAADHSSAAVVEGFAWSADTMP